jgi:hypothetical protein
VNRVAKPRRHLEIAAIRQIVRRIDHEKRYFILAHVELKVGIVNVPNVVSGQTYRQYDRRDDANDNHWNQRRNTTDDGRNLQGTWYLAG